MPGSLEKRIGIASIFDAERKDPPYTVIEVGPCVVMQTRILEKDGYEAMQLGLREKKGRHTTWSEVGHFKKAGVAPQRYLVEFRNFRTEYKLGDVITVDFSEDVGFVDTMGTPKGKGSQDAVKCHGFGGVGQTTHDQHSRARKSGFIGACPYPAKVFRDMRMGGQIDNERVTAQNFQVIKVMPKHNLLLVGGFVPGAGDSILLIEK